LIVYLGCYERRGPWQQPAGWLVEGRTT
jgi:hypothetical protein